MGLFDWHPSSSSFEPSQCYDLGQLEFSNLRRWTHYTERMDSEQLTTTSIDSFRFRELVQLHPGRPFPAITFPCDSSPRVTIGSRIAKDRYDDASL